MNTYRVEFSGVAYVSASDKQCAEDLILSNLMYSIDFEEADAEAEVIDFGDEYDG